MKQLLKTFFIFFIPLAILYYPTRNAGFVTDFNGWYSAFESQSFVQLLNGDNHNIQSFYHFTHILMYIMTSLFGKWGPPWYFAHCFLTALDAVLVYNIFIRLSRLFGFQNVSVLAFVGIAFWLASPYIAEVMVWRAAFHYPLVFAMQMGYIILLLSFIETNEKKYIYYANSIFITSLFCLEYFFLTPLLACSTLVLVSLNNTYTLKDNIKKYSKAFVAYVLIPLILIGFYTLAFKLHYGKWVSHNRETDAPFMFFNLDSYSTFFKYIAKHLFFIRHLELPQKEAIFNLFSRHSNQIAALIILFTVTLGGLLFFRKMNGFGKMLFWCFSFFSILLLPALSLHFSTMLLTENDRFAFIPSVFLMLCFAMLLSRLPRMVFYSLSSIYLCFSLFLSYKTNQIWGKSATVYWSLMDNFKWKDSKDEVILLNVPENMCGMYMYRAFGYSSMFPEVMDIYKHTETYKNTIEAMRYNMTDLQDGARIVVDAPDTIRVILNQPGSWFIMNEWRADTYETPSYKALQREWDYQLILKPSPRKRILLYQLGTEWKVVDTTKVGIEQR